MKSDAKTLLEAHILGASAVVAEALKNSDRHIPQNPRWRRSNAPYYKPKYAEKLRETYDLILGDKSKLIIWRVENSNSINTLYLRSHQGREYLLDHLDPDCKYADAALHIRTKKRLREEPKGLVFFWEERLEPEGVKIEEFKESLEGVNTTPKPLTWKMKLEDFIEKAEDMEKLQLKNMEDNEFNRKLVAGLLDTLPNFYYMFVPEAHTLIVLRCDDPARMEEFKKAL